MRRASPLLGLAVAACVPVEAFDLPDPGDARSALVLVEDGAGAVRHATAVALDSGRPAPLTLTSGDRVAVLFHACPLDELGLDPGALDLDDAERPAPPGFRARSRAPGEPAWRDDGPLPLEPEPGGRRLRLPGDAVARWRLDVEHRLASVATSRTCDLASSGDTAVALCIGVRATEDDPSANLAFRLDAGGALSPLPVDTDRGRLAAVTTGPDGEPWWLTDRGDVLSGLPGEALAPLRVDSPGWTVDGPVQNGTRLVVGGTAAEPVIWALVRWKPPDPEAEESRGQVLLLDRGAWTVKHPLTRGTARPTGDLVATDQGARVALLSPHKPEGGLEIFVAEVASTASTATQLRGGPDGAKTVRALLGATDRAGLVGAFEFNDGTSGLAWGALDPGADAWTWRRAGCRGSEPRALATDGREVFTVLASGDLAVTGAGGEALHGCKTAPALAGLNGFARLLALDPTRVVAAFTRTDASATCPRGDCRTLLLARYTRSACWAAGGDP